MQAHGAVRLPLVHARALPGGAVEREFYESVKGAMSVQGMTDAEGDLATSRRSSCTEPVTERKQSDRHRGPFDRPPMSKEPSGVSRVT
jgi:microcystin degradation protein MlrC